MDEAKEFFDPMMLQFEEREPAFFAAYQDARGTFKAPVRAKVDENGQPTAKWRIEKAEKAKAKKENAGTKKASGTKAKSEKGSRSATTDNAPSEAVRLSS
jgi:hypothetical protein